MQCFIVTLFLTFLSLAGSARAQAAAEGTNLEDISDDDDDANEFVDNEEEEDIDLDADDFSEEEEEEEEEDTKMPPKTARKKTPPKKYADTADDLSSKISRMKVNEAKPFFMCYKCPFIMTTYNEGLDIMVKIEFFVPTLPREYFIPDVVNGGWGCELRIQVPGFFVSEERVIVSNNHLQGFNQNTHEAQSYKDVCEKIDAHFGMTDMIFGDEPQVADLPYQCEERVVSWEIQGYPNDLGELTDQFGGQQFHQVLAVVMRKLKTKRRTTGGFRVVGVGGGGGP